MTQGEVVIVLKSLDEPDRILIGQEAEEFLQAFFEYMAFLGKDPGPLIEDFDDGFIRGD